MKALGLEHVLRDLAVAGATVAARADHALDHIASEVRDDAKEMAPRGPTGDLRASIEKTRIKEGTFEVGSALRYAEFVEFGTYKDRPQPFIWPALDKHTSELISDLDEIAGDV